MVGLQGSNTRTADGFDDACEHVVECYEVYDLQSVSQVLTFALDRIQRIK